MTTADGDPTDVVTYVSGLEGRREVASEYDPPPMTPESRFAPDDGRAVELVAAANDRAQCLAQRILAAEKAIKRGQPSTTVLSILGGSEDV